ncbi:MAG: hypothetical protein QOD07_2136 [Frankiaceae bacterium]|nr:hypothetical protein [Frankiaceae bacterium]
MAGQLVTRRGSAEEWVRLWSHRPALLRVARRRVGSAADAEDIVEEALVRAAARGLDPTAAGPWLTRVVMNLSADLHRRRRTALRNAPRLYVGPDAAPDEQVCDRAEAAALAESLAQLPVRQQRAVLLTAAGLSPAEVATQMNATYKAVESLLARARAHLRQSVLGLAALGLPLRRLLRPTSRAAVATLPTAVCVAITTLTLTIGQNGVPVGSDAASRAVADLSAAGPAGTPAGLATDTGHRRLEPATHRKSRPAAVVVPVVPSAYVDSGRVRVHTGSVVKRKSEQSLLTSVRECLEGGIAISATYIGCNSARPNGTARPDDKSSGEGSATASRS